jgi:hypothetical protein
MNFNAFSLCYFKIKIIKPFIYYQAREARHTKIFAVPFNKSNSIPKQSKLNNSAKAHCANFIKTFLVRYW